METLNNEEVVIENKEKGENVLKKIKNNKWDVAICTFCVIAAVIVFLMFSSAANFVEEGGLEIMSIESVGERRWKKHIIKI